MSAAAAGGDGDGDDGLILHHYDISPFAEKIRLVLGLKGLAWASVIQPMVAPKPLLTPLTGGFRRTPVLQIGADIHCDTAAIAVELDRRAPTPAVLPPAEAGAIQLHATWAERVLMWPSARYVTARNAERLGPDFFADRAAMRGHPAPTPADLARGLAHDRAQLQLMLGWLESLFADGRAYLIGQAPNLGDFALYQRLWWLGAFDGRAADVLALLPALGGWMGRIAAIGHGRRREMAPEEALAVARRSEPRPLEATGEALEGRWVEIGSEDFAPDPVAGRVVRATAGEITLARDDDAVGRVHVHFPRLGYRVREAGP